MPARRSFGLPTGTPVAPVCALASIDQILPRHARPEQSFVNYAHGNYGDVNPPPPRHGEAVSEAETNDGEGSRLSNPAPEKRLVLRMLDIWRRARKEAPLPHASDVTVADVGADAPNVYLIDVLDPAGPRFLYVGSALQSPGAPTQGTLVAECSDETVLTLTSRYWREIVERHVPVTRGGVGRHGGHSVLYRSILMPLTDESGRISTLMGAVNWRALEEQHGAPAE